MLRHTLQCEISHREREGKKIKKHFFFAFCFLLYYIMPLPYSNVCLPVEEK